MADEWQPVVGGRAMLGDDAVTVLYRSLLGDRTWVAPHTWEGSIVSCDANDLTEHPDDARHRRLLESGRDHVNRGYDLQTVTRLQSAVQAIDQAEADHAS